MPARTKTKQELEDELKKLQSRVDKLKKTLAECQAQQQKPDGRQLRKKITTDIECIADFDLLKAKSVNISGGGICFQTSAKLPFEMRYEHKGKTVTRRAHLIWLEQEKKSGYNIGLKFVGKKKYPKF